MIEQAQLENWFSYHAPVGDQPRRYEALRAAGKRFAETVLRLTPAGSDQSAAIRQIREAVYTANAAVACAPLEEMPPFPARGSYGDAAAAVEALDWCHQRGALVEFFTRFGDQVVTIRTGGPSGEMVQEGRDFVEAVAKSRRVDAMVFRSGSSGSSSPG
jgi:hypothetical protein